MKRASAARPRGFTLLELLVVIFILSLLMGILLPAVAAAMRRAVARRTQAALVVCSHAVEAYQGAYSRFPWTPQVEIEKSIQAGKPDEVPITTPAVLAELRGHGTVNRSTNFLAGLNPRFIRDLGSGPTLVDPWDAEIRFRVDAATGRPVCWSLGPNGIDETADGTSPDPIGKPNTYYLFTSGDNGDDIVVK